RSRKAAMRFISVSVILHRKLHLVRPPRGQTLCTENDADPTTCSGCCARDHIFLPQFEHVKRGRLQAASQRIAVSLARSKSENPMAAMLLARRARYVAAQGNIKTSKMCMTFSG